jgi:hypothetical protein
MKASQSGAAHAIVLEPAANPVRKRRSNRIALIVGALFAGAASAALVIVGLHLYYGQRREPRVALRPVIVHESPTRTVRVDPPPAPEPPIALPEKITPTPVEPPSTDSVAPRHRRDRVRPTNDDVLQQPLPIPGLDEILGGGDPSQPDEPLDPLREATRALQSGDPGRCIEILDEAIGQGAPAIAVRRRADCLEAAGQRDAAVRTYQRFCRLVPDHPAIDEVRTILEGWGQTCP